MFLLVSSCLKSLHSQTPNPFIPLGNMYSLFCGWRINTGGQRDETSYGKINCFLLLTNNTICLHSGIVDFEYEISRFERQLMVSIKSTPRYLGEDGHD